MSDTDKRYHPLLGLDDKAAFKGERRNDSESNINAFSSVLRERDHAYYSEMPMNTFETDPGNVSEDQARVEALRAVLRERVEQIRTQKVEEKLPAPQARALKGSKAVVACDRPPTFWEDLSNWHALPVAPGLPRFHYVLTRNNRLQYIATIIVGLMIFGYIVHLLK